MTRFRTCLMATALFAGVAGIGLTPAFAQTAQAPTSSAAQSEAHHNQGRAWMMPGQLVDGRIAFLKAELKITPAQEGQWQQFAAVMRQNAQSMDQAIASARQHRRTAENALDHVEMRAQFAKIRAENEARLANAFQPLYSSLSPEQQQVANTLVALHAGGHHGWHHRA